VRVYRRGRLQLAIYGPLIPNAMDVFVYNPNAVGGTRVEARYLMDAFHFLPVGDLGKWLEAAADRYPKTLAWALARWRGLFPEGVT